MSYITKEGLRSQKPRAHFYSKECAGCHMHPSMCKSLLHIEFSMYTGPPNGTAWAQGCDKAEINQRFVQHVENFFLEWLAPVVEALGEKEKVPSPPSHLMAMWIRDAWELISEDDIKAATHAAYFSCNGF